MKLTLQEASEVKSELEIALKKVVHNFEKLYQADFNMKMYLPDLVVKNIYNNSNTLLEVETVRAEVTRTLTEKA